MSLCLCFLLQLFALTGAQMFIPLFLLPFPIWLINIISVFMSGLVWCISLQVNSGPKETLLTFQGQWFWWQWWCGFFPKCFILYQSFLAMKLYQFVRDDHAT